VIELDGDVCQADGARSFLEKKDSDETGPGVEGGRKWLWLFSRRINTIGRLHTRLDQTNLGDNVVAQALGGWTSVKADETPKGTYLSCPSFFPRWVATLAQSKIAKALSSSGSESSN